MDKKDIWAAVAAKYDMSYWQARRLVTQLGDRTPSEDAMRCLATDMKFQMERIARGERRAKPDKKLVKSISLRVSYDLRKSVVCKKRAFRRKPECLPDRLMQQVEKIEQLKAKMRRMA